MVYQIINNMYNKLEMNTENCNYIKPINNIMDI